MESSDQCGQDSIFRCLDTLVDPTIGEESVIVYAASATGFDRRGPVDVAANCSPTEFERSVSGVLEPLDPPGKFLDERHDLRGTLLTGWGGIRSILVDPSDDKIP
ncbi:hypothetical protein BRD06_09440 [Halobacteriales archaeon QS_9_67_15]|nr:MAG: hypothetical protein BRD06_09440 [Halobacteriales archaeon QS_9_67_15]